MFDIRWIRENAETFDEGLRKRGLDPLAARLIALVRAVVGIYFRVLWPRTGTVRAHLVLPSRPRRATASRRS